MPERFESLPQDLRREALPVAAERSGRPAAVLEKDAWAVWTLRALFETALGDSLVLKGGTSLSKAYGAIRRFYEDVALTYDIRAIAPDLVGRDEEALPPTRSTKRAWTRKIRERLPTWIESTVRPALIARLNADGAAAGLEQDGARLRVRYEPATDHDGDMLA